MIAKRCRAFQRVALCVAGLSASTPSFAEEKSGAQAAEHFERGMLRVQQGDVAAAAREFEAAYRLKPHYSVLYNLGQAYVLMGRPVEAIQVLSQYLENAGNALDRRRKAEVQNTIALSRKRIGELTLTVEPKTASVEIDGSPVKEELQKGPLSIASGRHALVVTAPGYVPSAQSIVIETQKLTTLTVRLSAFPKPAVLAAASLAIECNVPDVDVHVDDIARGVTPITNSLSLAPGKHKVRFSRLGYADYETTVTLQNFAAVACNLKPLSSLPNTAKGRIAVRPSEPDATIHVNGKPLTSDELPAGRHRVAVNRFGFETWQDVVTIPAGGVAQIDPKLQAQPEYVRDYRERILTRRTWAYVLGGTGVAFGGAALTFAVLASAKNEDYEASKAKLETTPSGDAYRVQAGIAHKEALAVQRLDYLSLGSAAIGTALVGAGVALFLTGGDPDKYPAPSATVSHNGIGFSWARRW